MIGTSTTPEPSCLDTNLVWVDCEMTGLDPERDRIVEIACIVTDKNLNVTAELGPIVIQQSQEVLENMSDWCKIEFKKNGLLERIKESTTSEKEAEDMIVNFLLKHVRKGTSPIAGNTVYMDKLFLNKYMPQVTEILHYRIIDVSTIKELVHRWYSEEEVNKIPEKKLYHLALDDIRESIEELKYYKAQFFRI